MRRGPAQRAPNAVGEARIATVEDLLKHRNYPGYGLDRHARAGERLRELALAEPVHPWGLALLGTSAEDDRHEAALGWRRGTGVPLPPKRVRRASALIEKEVAVTGPQEQFAELTRRTQENFKHLWEQWSQRSNELMKTMGSRSRSGGDAPGNPEEVLDAVFDFAENLIAQQRTFAKQMLRAASQGQQTIADVASTTGVPTSTTDVSAPSGAPSVTPPSSTSRPGQAGG